VGSAQKELKAIVKAAEELGWRVKTTRGDSERPQGALDNLLADLRRYGFKWKGR